MQGQYATLYSMLGPKGLEPGRDWNTAVNRLRDHDDGLRRAGNLVGYTVSSLCVGPAELVQATGNNYANAVRPPFDAAERAAFMAGIQEVIEVNRIIGA